MKSNNSQRREDFFYVIRLQIKHPYVTKDAIDKEIGLNSDRDFDDEKYGEVSSLWSYSSYTRNEITFSNEMGCFLRWLKERKDFFIYLNKTGGHSLLVASLPGKINIKDLMPTEVLGISCELKINLTIEVYPRLYA